MNLCDLTATEARQLLTEKTVSSEELTRACLDRITARNDEVKAFVHIDPDFSIEAARRADNSVAASALHGIPFAIKDVIDTAEFPTERGTPIHEGRQPVSDAHCVKLMREAGAVPLGKVVTTEYAMFTPNETRHPMNLAHTPGGSSSGTGAAVADRMTPIAFGNQTAGSLIRPAAYCGVFGLKPTHGTTNGQGILPLQLRFDTLGYMARCVEDLEEFYSIVSETDQRKRWTASRAPRIGFCETYQWDHAEPETREFLARLVDRLAATGIEVEQMTLPSEYQSLVDLHRRVLYRGIADSLKEDYERAADKMSQGLHDVIEEGRGVNDNDYAEALKRVEHYRDTVNAEFGEFDAILCPSTPGEPPAGTATGSPIFQVSWTLLGVPCLNLPVGTGPRGLPLGAQLIGRRFDDAQLMAIAKELVRDLEPISVEN